MERFYSTDTLEALEDFSPKLNRSSVDFKFLSPPAKEMRESKALLSMLKKKIVPGNLWEKTLEISWKNHGIFHYGKVGILNNVTHFSTFYECCYSHLTIF